MNLSKTRILTPFLLLMSMDANAVFQEIWKGYKVSTISQLRELEFEASRNALDVSLSANAWAFQLNAGYDDTFLDSLFSFNAQRTISNSYGVALKKPTFRYGTFSFEHTQTRVDISKWNNNVFSTTNVDQLYEAKNSLTYSYDILGRELPLKEETAIAKSFSDEVQNTLKEQEERIEFFRAYLAAKLQVYRTRLAEEFLKRSENLRKRIYKRFKDGLSREAEYLQARNAELSQEQELQKALNSLKESVSVIENILGRDIPEKYFSALQWKFRGLDFWDNRLPEKANPNLEALKAQIALIDKDLENFEDQRGHKLSLKASYTANAYTEDIDNSIYQGDFIEPRNDSKQVSLVYTIPLGMDYDSSKIRKLFIDKKRNEYQEQNLRDEIKLRKKVFKERLARLEKAYKFSDKQVKVAEKRVVLQQRLYLRGLGTFDETIRAEEELLRAKSSLYGNLYDYDYVLSSMAFVRGSLNALLNTYTD